MKVSKEPGEGLMHHGDPFPRKLPVQLAPQEVAELAHELAVKTNERLALEMEKADTARAFNDRIKPLKARIEEIAPVVQTGEAVRDVQVRWVLRDGGASAILQRLDTGEFVEIDGESPRALSNEEIQLSLGLAGTPAVEKDLIAPTFDEPPAPPRSGLRVVANSESPPPGPERRGTYDYFKAPVSAGRGKDQCPEEDAHRWLAPREDGTEDCIRCPVSRRPVAQPPAKLWPLMPGLDWYLEVRGDELWLQHATERGDYEEHGPAGWVPEAVGVARLDGWSVLGQTALERVPGDVRQLAADLLAHPPDGLSVPRPLAEAREEMARQRAADVAEPEQDEDEESSPTLSNLAKAMLKVLLPGPLELSAVRAKTNNRRPSKTAKNLIAKGLVEMPGGQTGPVQLTAEGRVVAEALVKEEP